MQLVPGELKKLFEESCDDILRTSYQNAQSGTRYVVYNVVEQVVLDQLRKDIVGKTMDAYIAKYLDTYAAVSRISKKVLPLSSFMARNRDVSTM